MESSSSPSTGSKSSRRSTLTKRVLLGVGVALAAALLLYFLGLSYGRSRVAEVEEQLQQAQEQLEQQRRRAIRAENRNHMLQGLALLYQTALDLDERNFGTANKRLNEAAARLGEVQQTNTASSDLPQLQRNIASTNLEVAVDLEGQREQVLGFAKRLRAMLPKNTSVSASPDPES